VTLSFASLSAGDRVRAAVLTAGGVGLLRPAPGTWGSLAGILLHVGLAAALSGAEWAAFPLAALFFGLTCALGGGAERIFGLKDPPAVVSDEVAGVLVAVAGTGWSEAPLWARAGAAFLLFRVFDIAKPWPVSRLERLPGGLGIAADDAAAGLIANGLLQAGLACHGRWGGVSVGA